MKEDKSKSKELENRDAYDWNNRGKDPVEQLTDEDPSEPHE